MTELEIIKSMAHSPLHNYVIPGLTSWVVGQPIAPDNKAGCVRLFTCERDHYEPITPHSHRFPFYCRVLSGSVRNILWTPTNRGGGNAYRQSRMVYQGTPGAYVKEIGEVSNWKTSECIYEEGDSYWMAAADVHSIFFSKDSAVLFYEGPPESDFNLVLEPVANGQVIETMKVEPWMFAKA